LKTFTKLRIICILKYRRKKHPKYFELYDNGFRLCIDTTHNEENNKNYLLYRVNLLTEGLKNNEFDEEYFKQHFTTIAEQWIINTKLNELRRDDANKFFDEADAYAKENNLKWGIIYD
jgi:hypothetical protein